MGIGVSVVKEVMIVWLCVMLYGSFTYMGLGGHECVSEVNLLVNIRYSCLCQAVRCNLGYKERILPSSPRLTSMRPMGGLVHGVRGVREKDFVPVVPKGANFMKNSDFPCRLIYRRGVGTLGK